MCQLGGVEGGEAFPPFESGGIIGMDGQEIFRNGPDFHGWWSLAVQRRQRILWRDFFDRQNKRMLEQSDYNRPDQCFSQVGCRTFSVPDRETIDSYLFPAFSALSSSNPTTRRFSPLA